MNPLRRTRWSPYLVGTLLGMLTWLTFGVAGKSLGVSTFFSQVALFVESSAAPQRVHGLAYFTDYRIPASFGWEAGIFAGLILGGLAASWLSPDISARQVPALWTRRFGPGQAKSLLLSFLGGLVLIYGARLAGGCTSGHGISGSLQLAVSSWAFFLSLFVAGLATAGLLFRRGA